MIFQCISKLVFFEITFLSLVLVCEIWRKKRLMSNDWVKFIAASALLILIVQAGLMKGFTCRESATGVAGALGFLCAGLILAGVRLVGFIRRVVKK